VGLFSRPSSPRAPQYPTVTPEELARFGEMAFGGESPHPPGLQGIPAGELDAPALAYHLSARVEAFSATASRELLGELLAAAEGGGDWAYVGALCVGWNTVAEAFQEDAVYLEIMDRALEVMRTEGVSYTSVPPFAIDRWKLLHGYDGIAPAGWPSALDELSVVLPAEAPPVEDLAPGELRKLAQSPAAPANIICAERRADGTIQAVMEGTDPDTGQVRRWDWEGLNAPDYPAFLRDLGDRLITHSFWVHDDVIPYFPCRRRSRDQMRIEARAWRP
jgi:hypothetical protein